MRAETLVGTWPSDEVDSTIGQPCGEGMAAEVRMFRGICLRRRSSLVREDQRVSHKVASVVCLFSKEVE